MGSKRKSNAVVTDEQPACAEKLSGRRAQRTAPREIVPAEQTRVFMGEVFDSITKRLHDQIWGVSDALRSTLEAQSAAENKIPAPKRQHQQRKTRKTKDSQRQLKQKMK